MIIQILFESDINLNQDISMGQFSLLVWWILLLDAFGLCNVRISGFSDPNDFKDGENV